MRRLLQQWPALKSYFMSHDEVEKAGRVQRCASLLQDPEMELVYRFIEYIMGPLNEFNTTFQVSCHPFSYFIFFKYIVDLKENRSTPNELISTELVILSINK